MVDQQGQVFDPFPQRGNPDRQHLEPEIQVFPKLPVGHHGFQVAVRGRQHAHVHLARLRRPHALDHAVLEHPEQFRLAFDLHVADFVQKNGAAVGDLEFALAACFRARERPFFVPEQLAFHQGVGNRRAIDHDKRPGFPRPVEMDVPGDHLLAGARFALDQHRARNARRAADRIEDLLHGRALPNEVAEGRGVADQFAQLAVFAAQLGLLERLAHHHQQLVLVERFCQIVAGALFHRGDRRLNGGVRGHDHDRKLGTEP
ncbi:MAG: hypothetical protein BWY59_01262 [Verrucomicrobia bacterium ADurb.Bin345]|nr:MAG: hypothetical protein BWY59_01262 [Verrucomicrobia bacterium ADurb.Bin345]